MKSFLALFLCFILHVNNGDQYFVKIAHVEGDLEGYNDLFVTLEDDKSGDQIGETQRINPLYQKQWNEEFTFDAPQEPKLKLFNGNRYDFIGYTVITSGMIQQIDCEHEYADLATLAPWNKAKIFIELTKNCIVNSGKRNDKNKEVKLIRFVYISSEHNKAKIGYPSRSIWRLSNAWWQP